VFITNLPADYTEQNMMEIFKESGLKCIKANLLQDRDGRSKCAGFVEFAGNSEAQEAVKHAHNMSVNNKRLNVQLSKQ
jgi:RNA recognition motif-containing protein